MTQEQLSTSRLQETSRLPSSLLAKVIMTDKSCWLTTYAWFEYKTSGKQIDQESRFSTNA